MSQYDAYTPMDQPVFLKLVDLPPAPVQKANFERVPRPPQVTMAASIPGGITLPQPELQGYQIFAPPLPMVVLPPSTLPCTRLAQTPAHWTKMPPSEGAVRTPRLPCPSVPQTGFVSAVSLPTADLPRPPPLFRPIQPPNSTPDMMPWS
jgi:hypothetical protein